MNQIDRSKSLQQLDGKIWGKPTIESHLVNECQRLHRLPLSDFTVEDLRIMIGQNIGLEYLVPLALERLRDDPFAEGACYPCDLLVSVLCSNAKFWESYDELCGPLVAIATRAFDRFPTMPDIASEEVTSAVSRAFNRFREHRTKPA